MTMLVLTRRTNEQIIIGEGDNTVTLTVVRVDGCKVRIGVDAPKAVQVHRKEIYDLNHPFAAAQTKAVVANEPPMPPACVQRKQPRKPAPILPLK